MVAVRHDEHKVLQKTAFLQSFSYTVSPLVTVMATIGTLLGYV